MKGETGKQEPLSPELALVDPELAAAARERLPELPQSYAVPTGTYEFASRFVAEYERAAGETDDQEEPRQQPIRRRRRGRYAAFAVALLALPLALWALDVRGDGDVARSSTPSVDAPPPAPAPGPPSVATQTTEAQTTTAAARRRTRRPRAPARRADASRRGRSPAPAHARPAPVVRWTPVRKATFYWFQLYRLGLPGTAKILDAWPRGPRFEIPRAWANAGRRYRLAAGSYRWEVWPQFGRRGDVRYTRKLAQGTFRVAP